MQLRETDWLARYGGDDVDAILHRVDEAVYAAKDAGRNRVVTRLP